MIAREEGQLREFLPFLKKRIQVEEFASRVNSHKLVVDEIQVVHDLLFRQRAC
jgi:hypothetical protein